MRFATVAKAVALRALMDMLRIARGSPLRRGSLEIPFAAE